MSMHQYVVYDKTTKDYPGQYVVRKFTVWINEVSAEKTPVYVGDDLTAARRAIDRLAPGFICMQRMPSDDAVILEVWL